jgi:exosortase
MIFLLIAYTPTFVWMWGRWLAKESYYGHGFLIPIISLYVVWQRRKELKKAKISSEMSGLILVVAGLLIHIVCALLKIYFISGFSFVFVLYGLILFCFGKDIARNLVFPVFFLAAMIPLPLVLIGNLTVKLKLLVAQMATFTLNKIGFPSVRDGSFIRMPNSYIAIEAPCSGLRSLIALLTLGLLFAFAMNVSKLKKSVLFLSSVPIAMAANLMRIILLATVNDLYGEKVAMGFFHDFSGFLLFGVAFTGLFIVSRALDTKDER